MNQGSGDRDLVAAALFFAAAQTTCSIDWYVAGSGTEMASGSGLYHARHGYLQDFQL